MGGLLVSFFTASVAAMVGANYCCRSYCLSHRGRSLTVLFSLSLRQIQQHISEKRLQTTANHFPVGYRPSQSR